MRHFPHHSTHWPSRGPPRIKQVDNQSRHNLRHLETTEESTLQSRSHVAMKKKIIHGLPILFAQIASVYHNNMPLPDIIQVKDLAKCR
jgi:hypothetical protein